jgi:hypothetical protein
MQLTIAKYRILQGENAPNVVVVLKKCIAN